VDDRRSGIRDGSCSDCLALDSVQLTSDTQRSRDRNDYGRSETEWRWTVPTPPDLSIPEVELFSTTLVLKGCLSIRHTIMNGRNSALREQ